MFLKDLSATTLAMLGGLLSVPDNVAQGIVMREGMPMFHSLLVMVFVAFLPVLLVFARYEVGTVLVLSLIYFGMQFVCVLWGVAFWVDQQLFSAIMGNASSAEFNLTQMMIFTWSQRFPYMVFPMIWMAGMGWVGVHAQMAFTQGVNVPGQQSGEFAGEGGRMASSVATGGARGAVKGVAASGLPSKANSSPRRTAEVREPSVRLFRYFMTRSSRP